MPQSGAAFFRLRIPDLDIICMELGQFYHCDPFVFLTKPISHVLFVQKRTYELRYRQAVEQRKNQEITE